MTKKQKIKYLAISGIGAIAIFFGAIGGLLVHQNNNSQQSKNAKKEISNETGIESIANSNFLNSTEEQSKTLQKQLDILEIKLRQQKNQLDFLNRKIDQIERNQLMNANSIPQRPNVSQDSKKNVLKNEINKPKNDSIPNTTIPKEKPKSTEVQNPSVATTLANAKLEPIRVGHWNVFNLGDKTEPKNIAKYSAITNIIKNQKMNLIGLTEVKKPGGVEKILEVLNEGLKEQIWQALISSPSTTTTGTQGQSEQIAILYQKTLLAPIPFEGYSTAGLFYENNRWTNPFIPDQEIDYVRPPFGAKFKIIANGEDFTVVYSHNDAPGPHRKKRAYDIDATKYGFPGQGLQEVNEALRLKEVMEWFDQIDGANEELFYMGDTNIKLGNEAKAFAPLISSGYTSLFPESEANATTLSTKAGKQFASPYDKMFYKGQLPTQNAQKGDIFELVKNPELVDSSFIDSPRKISDHTFTFVELLPQK
ncbi:MnuA family membrane nuclease [Candidatus Mycoplasma pogonae]